MPNLAFRIEDVLNIWHMSNLCSYSQHNVNLDALVRRGEKIVKISSQKVKKVKSYSKVSKYSLIVVYFRCGYSFVPSTPPDDSISKYV